MSPYPIAVIGLGEIGLNRHLPVIDGHARFEIVASADQHPVTTAIGGKQYHNYREMLAVETMIEAVAICTPPDVRGCIALDAIAAGKHVLLEKPPCATLGELRRIRSAAERAGVTLMAGWHSQFNPAVDRAREILADQQVARLEMTWNEDVAVFHPGQTWIWQPGGFGVLDAGVNGISILTRILPDALVVRSATMWVPHRSQTPIAVEIDFAGLRDDDRFHAEMDWRTSTVERSIDILTWAGRRLRLLNSGRRLEVDGTVLVDKGNLEYPLLYDRFAELIGRHESELDEWPMVVVADTHLVGRTVPDDTII